MNVPLEHVFDTMRKNKLSLYNIYSNGKRIACNEDKTIDPQTCIDEIQHLLEISDPGVVEITLPLKEPGELARKGGDLKPKFSFTVKVGGSSQTNYSALQGIRREDSNEVKELRESLRAAEKTIEELRYKADLKKIEDKFEERIAGLQDEKNELLELGKQYLPQILGMIFPQMKQPTVLNGPPVAPGDVVVSEAEEINSENALEVLDSIYGEAVVSDLLCDLAAAARKDSEKVKLFFPMVKNLNS